LVIALVIILIYLILREGLKRAGEKHGSIAVITTAIVFGLLIYLHLYLYALLDFLLLVIIAYFSIRSDMIRVAREERKNIKLEETRRKVREKAAKKKSKKVKQ
jgi:uncharacterized membrane protein